MQTKIFVHHSAQAAEEELNSWLKENKVNVQYIGQSQSEQGGKFVFIISVFYKKLEEVLAMAYSLNQSTEEV
jgi:hypothetical protein